MRNNLRVILAKKNLKISNVVNGTGLSKTTVRALFYEKAKGIQFRTFEALCQFLDCEVGELFEMDKEGVY